MPSAELPSTQETQEPAADHPAPCSGSLQIAAEDHRASFESLVQPEAAGREASAQPRAHRRRGPAAVRATALWLRRALADAARAWALAAGVPPDLYR